MFQVNFIFLRKINVSNILSCNIVSRLILENLFTFTLKTLTVHSFFPNFHHQIHLPCQSNKYRSLPNFNYSPWKCGDTFSRISFIAFRLVLSPRYPPPPLSWSGCQLHPKPPFLCRYLQALPQSWAILGRDKMKTKQPKERSSASEHSGIPTSSSGGKTFSALLFVICLQMHLLADIFPRKSISFLCPFFWLPFCSSGVAFLKIVQKKLSGFFVRLIHFLEFCLIN